MIRHLLPAGTYLVAGTIAQAVLAFSGNLVMLRALAPDEFGRFAVTLAAISLIAGALSLRLGVVIIRTPDAEFSAAFRSRYFTAMLAETVLITGVSGLWLIVSGRTAWVDALLVAAIAIQAFCSHARAFWERTMPYRRLAAIETGVVAFAHAVGVAVVLSTGSAAALYIREAAAAAATFIALRLVGGLVFQPLSWPARHEWRQVFREARGVWLDSILEGLFQRFSVIAAAILAGDHGAGLFSMAQRLALLPHQIIQPLGRIASNWFSRTAVPDHRRKGRDQLLLAIAFPLVLVALIAVGTADPLVPWLFGDHWRGAIPILIAMSGAMLFISMFEVARSYALALNQTRALLGARAAQFGAFLVGAGGGWAAGEGSLIYLGVGLSAAFAAAFAVQIGLSRRLDAT